MAAQGFPRTRRLTNGAEYDAVFKQSRYRVNSAEFLVLACENGKQQSRVGTVVSKKVSGNAVERNRIRRLIKESFRLNFECEGLDVVVVARPPVKNQPNRETLDVLAKLWKQIEKKRQAQS